MLLTKIGSAIVAAKTQIIIFSLVFVIGTGFGIWIMNEVYAAAKINQLEDYIDLQAEQGRRTASNLETLYKGKLANAEARVEIRKVVKYVKDNRECDINSDTERLLDLARTGMPDAPRRDDEGVARPAAITQRQQIESCARDGDQYKELNLHYRALKQFIHDTRK